MSTVVYEEIKDLSSRFSQSISKADFIQIISYISRNVILTHINKALAFLRDEDKIDYLKNYLISLKKTNLQNKSEKVIDLGISLGEAQNNILAFKTLNNKSLQEKMFF
ncbi:hypothetical protein GLOIN_2v1785557 [Rhizophagus clarus]|uniref:Uncharacterized protein n=1 Tax=Rhizophagus clarus TaxID=94130 RepID=A0A8H3QNV6_9GLOM|nr:hypothetical protein GLOIN_2v1785557 [Rhizophagus clarus]